MNAQQKNLAKNNLSAQEQSLVLISAFMASGNLEQLKTQLNSGLDTDLSINQIKEAITQLYAYCGFPKSLNAINLFRTVLDERKVKGITDKEGKKTAVENKVADKYEQGRKVLETLTKTSQAKPAPGFGDFAPRIDTFFKGTFIC
ncbi:carboxymuconolactone decarboxylase family protein [Pedobacter sp. NJ-S-72]